MISNYFIIHILFRKERDVYFTKIMQSTDFILKCVNSFDNLKTYKSSIFRSSGTCVFKRRITSKHDYS